MNLEDFGLDREAARKLASFVQDAATGWRPEMILLVGSYASGRYVRGVSDIDILVVADNLAPDYFERLGQFDSIVPQGLPLEILAYTPREFTGMLREAHPSAVDAIEFGQALVGDERFAQYGAELKEMYRRGLTRTAVSLRLPPGEAS